MVPNVKASKAGSTSANSTVATPLRLCSFRERRRVNLDEDIARESKLEGSKPGLC